MITFENFPGPVNRAADITRGNQALGKQCEQLLGDTTMVVTNHGLAEGERFQRYPAEGLGIT